MEDPKPAKPAQSKKLPLPVVLAIGCLGFLVLLGILTSVAIRLVMSRPGLDFLKNMIGAKTGISINTQPGKEGVTYTDPKTGAKMAIGAGAQIPSDFPKDFPVYPGAKPVGNLSGAPEGQKEGFWLILSTPDTLDRVQSYYREQLPKNGWTIEDKTNSPASFTLSVAKDTRSGSVSLATDAQKKETSIVILLETKNQE